MSKSYVRGGRLSMAQVEKIERMTARREAARALVERLTEQIDDLAFCPHGWNVSQDRCAACDQLTGSRGWAEDVRFTRPPETSPAS